MSGSEANADIRGGAREQFLGTLAGWVIRIYSWTLRLSVDDKSGVLDSAEASRGLILAVWHNRIFPIPPGWRKIQPDRKTVVLTSASRDGSILAAAATVFHGEAARGSSSRRSRAAIVGLLRKLRDGYAVVITPDGPRGPRYRLQPGVVKLAQASGAPVVPVRVEFGRAWRLNSWDRFRIPCPFSKVKVVLEEALDVPRQLDEDSFERERRRIEMQLRVGVEDLLPEDEED